ncbi:MAG: hypothetical protein JSS54_05785 [Proteobacteria bacterium]|nr:hypothetical protein [Pseudomonadota bacterium]MBS0268475.1 hypothetical protein [Pseudomonadota bacterium]
MTTRAIWIIGTPFSGSTLTQLLLGRFAKVFIAGEIDRIRAFNMHPHLEHDPKCYLDSCAYCRAHDLACPVWTPSLFEELSSTGPSPGLYECLARAVGSEVILDSSKTPWWFLNLSKHRAFSDWRGRILTLHCVRHPFAFALSLANRTGQPLEQCVLSWVIINRDALNVVQISRAYSPVLVVYHNDLLRDPEGFLVSLANWANLGELEEYRPQHFLGGNVAAWPFKPKSEQSAPQFDASIDYFARVDPIQDDDGRWRSKIDQGMRWRLASLPGVREMSAMLGIDIDALIAS